MRLQRVWHNWSDLAHTHSHALFQYPFVISSRLVYGNYFLNWSAKWENKIRLKIIISSVAHRVWLFVTPWTAERQASLSVTNSQKLPKLMSIESVMPPNHLILCRPLFLPPSIFPSIRVFSNVPVLHIRWPKYWSFSFSISPSNEHSGLISFKMVWLDLLAVQGIFKSFSNTTVQKHQFFGAQLSI